MTACHLFREADAHIAILFVLGFIVMLKVPERE